MNEREAMKAWTAVLTRSTGLAPTDAVAEELSRYSGLPPDEVRKIAKTSSKVTGQKWAEADRSTPEGLNAFYQSVTNWVYGTLSYHARQAEGENIPLPVITAAALDGVAPGEFLDFGAGVGTASLMFSGMGWHATAADVARPLLEFARWRFKEHHCDIPVIDLNEESLPENRFDVVAAFNTMAHVPNIAPTVENLWRCLKPGGLLIFDIDTRKPSQKEGWHLLASHYPYLRVMRRSGFTLQRTAGPMYIYRRNDRASQASRVYWRLRDGLRYSAAAERLANLRSRSIHRIRSIAGRA